MAKKKYPGPLIPKTRSLSKLEKSAESCRGCDLYKNATQVVFGSGKATAQIMIVGEQPGNSEDLQGLPFVGAAGGVLRDCLKKAGIDLSDVYLTNAVKHFKWVPAVSGKRRIHQKPNAAEISACRPWLDKQIEVMKPKVLVVLGATAVNAVLGRDFSVTRDRGKHITGREEADHVVVSWHPSAILRSIDFKDSDVMREQLISDLKLAGKLSKK